MYLTQRLILNKTGVIFTRKPNQEYHLKHWFWWGFCGWFLCSETEKKKDFLNYLNTLKWNYLVLRAACHDYGEMADQRQQCFVD